MLTIYLTEYLALQILLAMGVALLISLLATPPVKWFAQRVGAMDVPKDNRRVHKEPIPRLGGLAIFIGFVLSVALFAEIDRELQGILIGSVLIVFVGVVDDILPLRAWQKFFAQIVAAGIVVWHGVTIDWIGNPNIFSAYDYLNLGFFSIPLTILWIVGITNAVNLIDGLDGLAVGVSTIASLTMLAVALIAAANGNVAIVFAALAGACLGFMPYNVNPAKIFMGDTGALLLGYLLATMSITGLFKFYALISFVVPFMALALPIADTTFAILRRIIKKQNPMMPDRGHLHHRLLDLGFTQKQAVFIIYLISGALGLFAVVITSSGEMRIVFTLLAFIVIAITVFVVFRQKPGKNDITSDLSPEEPEDIQETPEIAPEVSNDAPIESSHIPEGEEHGSD
ncbi:MAG: undecaprenyl/decaprenyl-phosphate alpha-N-acetylglucosaminyl 1-phosphate transferase [Oscillospiraceae bacterium]|nr:undecaprenyl/decaprenyl-phosphate alpha-N-acetylglucosaminyl 1-phosphate transferase [Oscillospiraceae bacterium]